MLKLKKSQIKIFKKQGFLVIKNFYSKKKN